MWEPPGEARVKVMLGDIGPDPSLHLRLDMETNLV